MKRILIFCLTLMLCCAAAHAGVLPYTVSLTAGEYVYSGPGADFDLVQTVGEDGVFTIVEEAHDADGSLWGRLKSGAGWVSLSGSTESPFTVSLNAGTPVYTGSGYDCDVAEVLSDDGVFTITEEVCDNSGNLWGRLKSGAGWVPLNTVLYMTSQPEGAAIYSGPGYGFTTNEILAEDGVFTIVSEAQDADGNLWGRLKSGAGWIPLSGVSYVKRLYAGDKVFGGPGYRYGVEETIQEDGSFTIIDELWDADGNLWGKLKSGAGWVFLKSESAMVPQPIYMDYASDTLLQTARRAIIDDSEYAVHIALFPSETLTDVVFTTMELTDADLEPGEPLLSLGDLLPDEPVVISVSFPGDMTAYGLSFTDASGVARRYTLSISGYDGSLVGCAD